MFETNFYRKTFLLITLSVASNVIFATGLSPDKIREIEKRLNARIGVSVIQEDSKAIFLYRELERFPMASTFKTFACAAVLKKVDENRDRLDRKVFIVKNELVPYSPVTEQYGDKEISLEELCLATITLSDNTAGNLILKAIDGPTGFTDFMRKIDDKFSQLSRWEVELNEGLPGDLRDTTTPSAITSSLRKIIFGNVLSDTSKKILVNWMIQNKVADKLIRSVLPKGWIIADKTGAGGFGTRGIVAIIWPPSERAVVVAIYITETQAGMDERNAAIAEIGKLIINSI